jgi:hypothetical protein
MKKWYDYRNARLLKQCIPPRLKLSEGSVHIFVLTNDDEVFASVERFFPSYSGVLIEHMRRPKGEEVKTTHLYTNDFSLWGEPKYKVPEPPLKNAIVLNTERNNPFLTWYWCNRQYDYRVDLHGIYDNADITITGAHSLEEKLGFLKQTLERINHE